MVDLERQNALQPMALNGEQLLRNETMKRNQVTLAVLLAALSFVAAPSASAISVSQVQAIRKVVADVPPPEIAARTADLVIQAPKADRKDVALTAIREVVAKRPATVVPVVAAISKAAPEVSAVVAAEAAKLATDQAAAIAKAAAGGAPSQAEQIAAAVAKAVPGSATQVTRSVATVVPDQVASVSEAVVKSVPTAAKEITADPTIQRLSRRSSSTPTGPGIITTIPGFISGKSTDGVPPPTEFSPTPGIDSSRPYASPGP